MIHVLLIEDDPMVQEVNREFVERVAAFKVVGIATNGVEGLEKIRALRPDLVILDIFMPQQDGITTLQLIRLENLEVDVIAITAANDARSIQSMLQNGAIDYIIKPFKFERVKQALNNYRMLKERIEHQQSFSQSELDQLMFGNTSDPSTEVLLPKGMQEITLKQIILYLMNQTESRSAEEVAEGVGLARVTARRYLDYLEKIGKVTIDLQYGGVGRPINRYVIGKKIE
ncbi:response regulator [Paenibacillus baekrokdamisoli]|uniref:response regulator n=1 Tax=Paenibacillus baekrokdamisoli TaxID=1712516 RepID=UPI000F76A8A3|nr:response regulator [Paenibacillus baekrokdamisoli]